MNLRHIAEGWAKSLGMMEVTPEVAAMSAKRLEVCSTCPHAKHSTLLQLLRGSAEEVDTIKCGLCGCPATEKSLVPEEQCKADKW